jgi:predicted SnoaL-like aldol condensation-catalyzing enzyme
MPGKPPTKEGALRDFTMMFSAVPDMRGETVRTVVSGNKVAIHSRATGTDSGTGFGAMMGILRGTHTLDRHAAAR